jgi:hypothetical protein
MLGAILLILSGCATHYHHVRHGQAIFVVVLPQAQKVAFVSSLNRFQPLDASETAFGVWEISVPASRGFRYFYRVDGKIYLPRCDMREKDDFGAENCIFDPEM